MGVSLCVGQSGAHCTEGWVAFSQAAVQVAILSELFSLSVELKTRTFSALLEMLRWFAGQQIRNTSVSI